MSRLGTLFIAAAVLAATPAWAGGARAATVTIAPGGLAAALGMAAAGDVLVLASGIHPGPVNIATPVTLEGQPGSVIDGGGRENTVTVEAPGVTLRKLTIRNSGLSLFDQNSGIFLGKGAAGAVVEDNVLTDNLIGVYVWGAPNVLVRGNRVQGRTDLRRSERGNGIQLWNAPGTRVVGNTVTHGRDGIFVTTSKRNEFRDNRFENVRFAVHYMYTNDSEVSGNVSVGNDVGYAIMFSRNLVIRGNQSRGDREHGLLLNATTSSRIEDNLVAGRYATPVEDVAEDDDVADSDVPHEVGGLAESARIGTWKCVFVYNTSKNTVRNNRFEDCEIGIHFTAGSERNSISGNAFVNNRTQVKYVGTRALDWSEKGRGNYWSDNPAFDLNGDGVADEAYRPNDMVDRVMWSFPAAKLLINSPGIQVIRWAQSQFPALHPGGVMDSAPLMAPPDLPNTPERKAQP
ncbi:carbohydrate-binding protein [Skermanella aerolata]|uniref:Carbohydrate-binding protein n=1 Tax=Skermanella aerolata TaxID=393310 RepID=A0A512DRQ2_9PROT|nr:nitrous oxide reductase family maturation protein NosD [Skermanella aerolata]KJB93153.1 carbohydrate-binding protein [Skermanella aerolata KACC 11604]GEO39105.1 carbohydrate-binding protein [Skermanella aerolata]